MRSSYKQLIGYLLRYKVKFGVVCAMVVVSNILALRVPELTGVMVDAIGLEGGTDFGVIFEGAAMIAVISVVVWLCTVLQNRLMLQTSQSMVLDLRHDVFTRLMKLPVSYFDKNTKGNIISIVGTDIDNISESVSVDLITILTSTVTIVGSLGFMLSISTWMTAIFVVTVPMMFISARLISKRSRRLFRDKKNSYGALCGYAEEMITGQKTVKVYGIETYNVDKFVGLSQELKETGSKAEWTSSLMMPSMNTINNLSFTMICLMGAVLVLQGQLTVGSISAFVLYSKRFSAPVIDIANLLNMFQVALAACDRVFSILNHPLEQEVVPTGNLNDLAEVEGEIVFEDVSFGYVEDKMILKGVNLTVKPGQKVAIVGATGSGKSTFMSLLMGFYEANKGTITIDGKLITSMPLDHLRQHFAMVLQESWLFDGSVYDNIAYGIGKEHTDLQTVKRLCQELGIDELIESLPQGYNTRLGTDEGGLSLGQKQLINIVRTFMCNPPLFILDEATSSVDPITELQIKKATDRAMQGKTSFVIAHRLSTILNADQIIMMRDGCIIESGTHESLMRQGGAYKELYESQFVGMDDEGMATGLLA